MPSTFPHSPADVIRHLLVAKGCGTLPSDGGDWPIYVASEPDGPDNCVTVYDTQGQDDGRSMHTGELWNHNGFQVRVRARDHSSAGWPKADEIQTVMAEEVYQDYVTIGDETYFVHAVTRIGDPIPLGKETPSSKRNLYTINATFAGYHVEYGTA